VSKIFKEATPGSRLLPSRTDKNDAEYQCRIDVGEEIKDKPGYYVYFQVNNLARSEGLNDWLKKNPHENLATAKINRKATDEERSEGKRVMSELIDRVKENL
jgi:hypothetical protein